MSENKLDKSLDDILSTRRTPGGRRGRGRRVGTASTRVTRAAPSGGVQKSTKSAKTTAKAATTTTPAIGTGSLKIIVSNLPADVNETQIKEYFSKCVGPVRRAMITYGPNGASRGIATLIFSKPGDASKAATQLNGVLVDKKPMRIEVVIDSKTAVPAKGLDERIAQPKGAKPKPATEKPATNGATATRGGRTRGRGGRRARNAGRPKPKTADELDAEMVDYFDATAATNGASATPTNGAAPAPAAEELAMEEIS